MRYYRVTARCLTPTLVSQEEEQQFLRRSWRHLPGAATRGALASSYLRAFAADGPHELPSEAAQIFRSVFYGEAPVLFTDLLPAPDGAEEVFPVPKTTFLAKYEEPEGRRARDRLLCKTSGPSERGDREHNPWERAKGYLAALPGGRYRHLAVHHVPTRIFVRTAIDRASERAAEGMLFALETLSPSAATSFTGLWRVPEETEEAFQALLATLREETEGALEVFVGSGRSLGYGRVGLEVVPCPPPDLAARLTAWRSATRDSNRLLLPFLLRAPLWCPHPTGVLQPPETAADFRRLGLPAPSDLTLVPEQSAAELEDVGGWSLSWGLPKERLRLVGRGSVLTYRTKRWAEEELVPFLAAVDARGLGAGAAQGFGEVVLLSPWHVAAREEAWV